MDYRKAFPSEFLKTSDLQGENGNYGTVVLTINAADVEDVGQNGERKLVLHFAESGQKLVLNRTNADELALMYGNDTDSWIGQPVLLWVDPHVRFGNKITPGLRVANPGAPQGSHAPQQPQAPAAQPSAPDTGRPAQTAMPVPPQTGEPMITAPQKTLLLREGQRVYGAATAVAALKERIGNVNALSYKNAEEWITWLKDQPNAPAAAAADESDDDPFGDE
jgi:hypothetical protein